MSTLSEPPPYLGSIDNGHGHNGRSVDLPGSLTLIIGHRMKSCQIVTFTTGIFSGALNPRKLQDTLNTHAKEGWCYARSIHETRRVFLIFSREVHFLIFERS